MVVVEWWWTLPAPWWRPVLSRAKSSSNTLMPHLPPSHRSVRPLHSHVNHYSLCHIYFSWSRKIREEWISAFWTSSCNSCCWQLDSSRMSSSTTLDLPLCYTYMQTDWIKQTVTEEVSIFVIFFFCTWLIYLQNLLKVTRTSLTPLCTRQRRLP